MTAHVSRNTVLKSRELLRLASTSSRLAFLSSITTYAHAYSLRNLCPGFLCGITQMTSWLLCKPMQVTAGAGSPQNQLPTQAAKRSQKPGHHHTSLSAIAASGFDATLSSSMMSPMRSPPNWGVVFYMYRIYWPSVERFQL